MPDSQIRDNWFLDFPRDGWGGGGRRWRVEAEAEVFIQLITSCLLMYLFWRYILIKLSMVVLELIQLVGSFEMLFLILVVGLSIKLRVPSLVWKYNFWLVLGIIFKSNKGLALKFSDLVRKMIPHLAPCNALQDDVSCNATTSIFMAKTYGNPILLQGLRRQVNPQVELDDRCKQRIAAFSSQVFEIGAGLVLVIKLAEDQFSFTCVVRGEFLEDFVAITDWKSMAIILHILEFWETSPKVGVIENLEQWGKGIYCHALNVKEIVRGVHASHDYFSIFHLDEERQFFVGCGRGSMSTSNQKASQGGDQQYVLLFLGIVVGAIGSFYQLIDTYIKVAITILVLTIGLASLTFMDFFGRLFKQNCFYWFCTMACFGQANWRLGIYLRLKKRGSPLPYCDEFKPDQLRFVDSETEVIYLKKSSYISRNVLAVEQAPDWTKYDINISNLGTESAPQGLRTGIDGIESCFTLYRDPNNLDLVIFKMKYTYSNWMVKYKEMVVRSVPDETQREQPTGTMTNYEVSLDGKAITYEWSVESFHLFVYLMLQMNHGVIEDWENSMSRTYYHVFSIHGLAAHIEKHELDSYFLLGAEKNQSIEATVPAGAEVVESSEARVLTIRDDN